MQSSHLIRHTLGDEGGLAGLLLPRNSVEGVLLALAAESLLLLGEVDLENIRRKEHWNGLSDGSDKTVW